MQSLLALHPPLATLDPPSGRVPRPISPLQVYKGRWELSQKVMGNDKASAQRLISNPFLKSNALFAFRCTHVCESHFAKLFFKGEHLRWFAVYEADFACCLDCSAKQRREVRFIGVP